MSSLLSTTASAATRERREGWEEACQGGRRVEGEGEGHLVWGEGEGMGARCGCLGSVREERVLSAAEGEGGEDE
jgi:hypothetical protein